MAMIGPALVSASLPAAAQTNAAPIKIGFGMALTGGLAAGGKAAVLVYQIWQEEVNARGGLLGRKVELVFYDDQSSPATVPGIYSKLLDVDKVDLIISGYGTVPTAAAMPVVIQRKKLFLSLFALAVNEQFNYPRYFQLQANGPDAKHEFSRGFLDVAMSLDPKPKTIALAGTDAEFPHIALDGARDNLKKLGINIVYDKTYPPSTIDFIPIMRAIKASNPELILIASYPPDTSGMIRAAHEVGVTARLFGGGLVGLQFAALKTQLGPLLNNIVCFDYYVPEPTLKLPKIEEFLVKYRAKAVAAGVDPLGLYIPPYAYAEMQMLEQAVTAVGSVDDDKLAQHIHKATFDTVVGDIKFADNGEWANSGMMLVQYQNVVGNDVEQFKQPGKQVIVYPKQFKSGDVKSPFDTTKR